MKFRRTNASTYDDPACATAPPTFPARRKMLYRIASCLGMRTFETKGEFKLYT